MTNTNETEERWGQIFMTLKEQNDEKMNRSFQVVLPKRRAEEDMDFWW